MKKLFSWAISSLILIGCNEMPAATKDNTTAEEKSPTANAPAEFADARYVDIGKKAFSALSSGDVDGWMEVYADNAVSLWNSGDSLSGKAAIAEYWNNRRKEIIETIEFNDQIWLPIKVNQPQSVEQAGVWLLSWHKIDVKYKTGKNITQWIHVDIHFDANDKVDRVIQYLDRAPIIEATRK